MNTHLSGEQVEAFRTVDLRLTFIAHGLSWPDFIHPENGPAVIGVNDKDYAAVDSALEGMSSGDIAVRERIFGGGSDPDHIPSNSDILSVIHGALHQSPYAGGNPLQNVPDFNNSLQEFTHDYQPGTVRNRADIASALTQSLEMGRQLWLVDPFSYMDGVAATKGITRAIADSAYEKRRRNEVLDTRIRNNDMVHDLGSIAMDVAGSEVQTEGRKPIVSFVAGRNHRGVKDLLSEQGVRFTSQTTRTPLAPYLVTLAARSDPGHALDRYYAAQWFRNLRAQGHMPKNTIVQRQYDV